MFSAINIVLHLAGLLLACAITQLARSALPTLACKTADFLWLIRKCTKKIQAILREINELLRSMKQFFLDSHVHFSLLNYIQNFSMSRK